MQGNTSDSQVSLETTAVDLSLAIGQLRRRLRAEVTQDGEFNLSQMSVLARLDQKGSMITADLARAESMTPQSMRTILAALEQAGLVSRHPHPTDGRQIEFSLTPAGLEARRKSRTAKREWLVAALAKLDGDEQRLLISAVALIKRLGAS